MNNEFFYTDLKINRIPLGHLLMSGALFSRVPETWHVVITDIKGSTNAVAQGLHNEVNLVATGSIVAVMNLAYRRNIGVPFFFGGDGATFILPAELLVEAMEALQVFREHTHTAYGLDLRVGTVPVAGVYQAGQELNIAKYCVSDKFIIPVVLGNGLSYAERLIKSQSMPATAQDSQEIALDLTGMQCRWDRIPPPASKAEIVTLLVVAKQVTDQAAVFRKVIEKIDLIYGAPQKRQPISVDKLRLMTTFHKLSYEMRLQFGKLRIPGLVWKWVTNLYGLLYFQTQKGREYLQRLVEMSDTLVIDGRINTVITGNLRQREELLAFLDILESAGEIVYGVHISEAAIMSCYVRDLQDDHIHFVDGAEGGYTQAAKSLKAKLFN